MSKQSWIVEIKAVVTKEVICEGCSEQQAQDNPFKYSVSETDMGLSDWDVISVTPND